jgi:hypothetical protein
MTAGSSMETRSGGVLYGQSTCAWGHFSRNPHRPREKGAECEIDGSALEVKLESLGNDTFTFKIEGAGNPVFESGNPLGVTFIIGNDTGATSVMVD